MRRTLKMWRSVGLTAVAGLTISACQKPGEGAGDARPSVEAGEHGAAGQVGEHGVQQVAGGDFGGVSFDAALAQVLEGEGGKGGAGFSPMAKAGEGYAFTVPALTSAQLEKAVSGNSLRAERHFALHLTPQGAYEGWSLSWAKAPMEKCPSKMGPNHAIMSGACWLGTENRLTGKWTVQDGQLCLSPRAKGVNDAQDCMRTAMVLNSLLFFGADGRVVGKGADLLPGSNVGRVRQTEAG